ncbi:MAG: glycoside hydrolase family 95-like protein, partial [Bacteroidota bacterium]
EFDCASFGKVISNELDIKTALSTIKFENGVTFFNYVHASKQIGYFGFENLPSADIIPALIVPAYNTGHAGKTGNSVEGQGLGRLGYKKGTATKTVTSVRYHQPTWNGNYYEVLIQWKIFSPKHIVGQWTITVNKPAILPALVISEKEPTGWAAHISWWKDYWNKSSVSIPDAQLEKQYYLEMYKFGCVARSNTPPISLQAIWTADNGNLPPWKGDYHHDLNTELSYWPGYTGNHLDLTVSYTNWLWKIKEVNKKWTKQYFDVDGLNVPGVTTISGKEMGGWIQYSMSLTTAAWVAQHFYWQYKYSMDRKFLMEKAYPYFTEVKKFLGNIAIKSRSQQGKIQLPLSSSPEYHNNSINAWFHDFTNYDLALVSNFYHEGAEIMSDLSGKHPVKWGNWLQQQLKLPQLDYNETGLTIAPGQNLDESHRHHAQLMAIYPLGYLSPDNNDSIQNKIISASLRWLEKTGTRNWCGYSFSWAASIYARAKEADNAANMLKIFVSNFCSSNSFHLNGDQKGGQYSSFTYRPFTLEGNFAFAQGVHEMLIQGYHGHIEIFPAIPQSWKNVSFDHLRTAGAFLVSAKKENGVNTEVTITAEKQNMLLIKLPFKTWLVQGVAREKIFDNGNGISTVLLKKGQTITFKNGYE